MRSLESLRIEINNIDKKIFKLIKKRLETSMKIGLEKKRLGLPIIDKEVTNDVIKKNQFQCIQLGLETQFCEELTYLLIKHSIIVQESL